MFVRYVSIFHNVDIPLFLVFITFHLAGEIMIQCIGEEGKGGEERGERRGGKRGEEGRKEGRGGRVGR